VQGRSAKVGPATDIYALGAILYQLLTGRPPFQGGDLMDLLSQVAHADPVPPRRLLPGLGRDIETICLKCLRKEPAKRYLSATALAEDLRRFLNNEAIAARPIGAVGRAWRWCYRNPLAAAALTACVACLLIGSGTATAFGVRANWLAGERQRALDRVKDEESKTKAALDRVTAEKQRAQDALDQVREALDVTSDEVMINLFSKLPHFGEPEKAFLRRILAQHQRLAAAAVDDTPESRFARAKGFSRCAAIRHWLGELGEAISAGNEAVALLRKLVEDAPDNAMYARRLALALNNLAVVQKMTGNPADAVTACREARDILGKFAADRHAQTEILLEMSAVHGHLGNLYSMTQKLTAAETSFRAAIAIDRELTAAEPTNGELQLRLAGNLQNFGKLLTQLNRFREAEPVLNTAQAMERDLPQSPYLRQQRALGLLSLSTIYRNTGRLPDAQEALEAARDLQSELGDAFPSAPDFRQQLSITLVYLAQVMQDRGKLPEAIDILSQAVDVREKLAASSSRRDYQDDLASARNTLGNAFKRANRLGEAATAFTAALAGWKDLAAAAPNIPEYANGAAGAMVNLAQVRQLENNASAARKLLEDAVPFHQAALKAEPRNLTFRRYYRNNRESLMHTTLMFADHVAAAAAANDLARCDVQAPTDAVNAAWAFARCSAVVEKDESLSTPERSAKAKEYRDQSVEMLRKAAELGYRDDGGIPKEPAFAPLLDRADFQTIMKKMTVKPKR
jgi:tetratricopeptide (TPR) repeat protein